MNLNNFLEKRKKKLDSVIEATESWIKELKSKKMRLGKKREIAFWEAMKKVIEEKREKDPLEELDKAIESIKVLYRPLIRKNPNYDTTFLERYLERAYQIRAELEAQIKKGKQI